MKVLQIACGFSYSSVYKNLFAELVKKKIDIEVYVPQHIGPTIDNLNKRDFNYPVYSNKVIKSWDKYIYFTKILRMKKDVEKNFKLSNIKIIHAHSLFSDGGVAYEIYKKHNIPYLVAVRDTDVNQYFKKAKHLKRYAVNILRNAAAVVFLSKPYKENVINKFVPRRYRDDILENSRVIPNGISSFWLSNKFYDKPNISFNNKIINLLFVGQVIRRKNIETTIRAITELKKRLNKKIKFIVIGEKKDLKYYDKISGLGSFEYKSYLTKEELINYYRNSDIFVMPSYTETFGLVYAEALTQGLPVIYSYDQGFDGQFKEGTVGYGVNPSNIEDIVNKIQLIFRRYATISRQCIDNVDKFDWKKISCTYKQLYTKICNK